MRAKREHPFISAPVKWEELEQALERNDPASLDFQPGATIERCEKLGDLFAPVLTVKQKPAKIDGRQ
jgi:bifunctional non-homologous end joining protein LigD